MGHGGVEPPICRFGDLGSILRQHILYPYTTVLYRNTRQVSSLDSFLRFSSREDFLLKAILSNRIKSPRRDLIAAANRPALSQDGISLKSGITRFPTKLLLSGFSVLWLTGLLTSIQPSVNPYSCNRLILVFYRALPLGATGAF